jgi:choline dehydrogenase
MWPGGKVLGGSSSINGMVYLRGQREDYDDWAAGLGNTGAWGYDDVLPYFMRMESNEFGAGDYHGGQGPLSASHVATSHPLAEVFIKAGQELAYPFNLDFNGARQEGVGPSQGSTRRGWRHNTGRAFLAPVRSRANLEVRTHAHIDRVLFEGKEAVGVRYLRNGGWQEARGAEIILACGSLSSPAVLMRSGIGPGDHLQEHGIEVIGNLEGVGNNLQEHPIVWVSGYVDISTYNTEVKPFQFVKHGLNWLLFGKGPAASPITQACAFIRTRPDEEDRPDIQLQFVPTGYKLVPEGLLLMDRPAVTILVNVCRPKSRSELRLASSDPMARSPRSTPTSLVMTTMSSGWSPAAVQRGPCSKRTCSATIIWALACPTPMCAPTRISNTMCAQAPALRIIRSAPAKWAGTRWQSSTSVCGFGMSRSCG